MVTWQDRLLIMTSLIWCLLPSDGVAPYVNKRKNQWRHNDESVLSRDHYQFLIWWQKLSTLLQGRVEYAECGDRVRRWGWWLDTARNTVRSAHPPQQQPPLHSPRPSPISSLTVTAFRTTKRRTYHSAFLMYHSASLWWTSFHCSYKYLIYFK